MRCNSPLVRQSGSDDLNTAMTPMIDVVFLLLVFFVWTASFQTIEYIMPPSELTSKAGTESATDADSEPPTDFEDIVVRIRSRNALTSWEINGHPATGINEVKNRLNTLAEINSAVVVILHPDPAVELEHVIGAYDTAHLAGFDKVSFAVN